jgi:hypothetical protein
MDFIMHFVNYNYKERSIISETSIEIWSKTNFGHTGHHHPQSSSLPCVSTFPSASAIFKCLLEVLFCEGVQHRLPFYLNNLSCAEMAAFHSHLQSGKQRKVGSVGDDSHVKFGQKFPSEKGSVK